MIATQTLTIDAVGDPEALSIDRPATKVTIREASGGASGAFNLRAPYATSDARRFLAGEVCTLQQDTGFPPGTIAYLEAVTGTLSMEILIE